MWSDITETAATMWAGLWTAQGVAIVAGVLLVAAAALILGRWAFRR